MFDTHILPILEYNSEIWFPVREIDVLERIQLKFLKNMLGVRNQTSTVAILADTGRFPLVYRQQASALKYWDRLRSSDSPDLLKNCYDIQILMHQNKIPCWLSKVHQITNKMVEVQDNPSVNKIVIALYEQGQKQMMENINDNQKYPKLRTYKLFKNELRLETYLNNYFPKYVYRSIARFRLSSHNLNIELGRHKRPYIPADERFCKRCNCELVEDEFHCLMICTHWNNIRIELLETAYHHIKNFTILSTKTQFLEIISSKENKMILALGKFLNVVLKTDNII